MSGGWGLSAARHRNVAEPLGRCQEMFSATAGGRNRAYVQLMRADCYSNCQHIELLYVGGGGDRVIGGGFLFCGEG